MAFQVSQAGRYKPKTLNNALGVLLVCLNQVCDDRLLQTNPAACVQRLPLGHREREYLRIHEIDLYRACCSTAYGPLAELLISCGLRISEVLGLIWRTSTSPTARSRSTARPRVPGSRPAREEPAGTLGGGGARPPAYVDRAQGSPA